MNRFVLPHFKHFLTWDNWLLHLGHLRSLYSLSSVKVWIVYLGRLCFIYSLISALFFSSCISVRFSLLWASYITWVFGFCKSRGTLSLDTCRPEPVRGYPNCGIQGCGRYPHRYLRKQYCGNILRKRCVRKHAKKDCETWGVSLIFHSPCYFYGFSRDTRKKCITPPFPHDSGG